LVARLLRNPAMIRELLDVQKLYRNTSDFPSKEEEENASKHFEKYFEVRKVRKKSFFGQNL
jgi:hypothetical protein